MKIKELQRLLAGLEQLYGDRCELVVHHPEIVFTPKIGWSRQDDNQDKDNDGQHEVIVALEYAEE